MSESLFFFFFFLSFFLLLLLLLLTQFLVGRNLAEVFCSDTETVVTADLPPTLTCGNEQQLLLCKETIGGSLGMVGRRIGCTR